jgi:protein-tyrosine kinase
MSRIHEALKKAEEERAAVRATDAVALPPDLVKAPSPGIAGAAAADVASNATIFAPPTGESLRLDDLLRRCAAPPWHLEPIMNVFSSSDVGVSGAEQFRTLGSRLYLLRGNTNGPLRRLLVTSAISGEGKTFVANNLAQAFARQPERRVLLIDGDLRRSRLHLPLGAPVTPGLTDYLGGEAEELAVIQHGMDGNLYFIAGGNEVTNPSDLLANRRLKILLDRVTPLFDWVVLDSPPCLPVADATVLAEHCDGVLLVVRAGVTPAEIAQRACQELKARNVVGVVLNAVEGVEAYGSDSYYAYGRRNSESKAVES